MVIIQTELWHSIDMKVDTTFSKKSAASIFKVDPDIPDTSNNTEEKIKIYIKESYTAAEIKAALTRITFCDKTRSTCLWQTKSFCLREKILYRLQKQTNLADLKIKPNTK